MLWVKNPSTLRSLKSAGGSDAATQPVRSALPPQENLAIYKRLQGVKPSSDVSRDVLVKHFAQQSQYGANARKFKGPGVQRVSGLNSTGPHRCQVSGHRVSGQHLQPKPRPLPDPGCLKLR